MAEENFHVHKDGFIYALRKLRCERNISAREMSISLGQNVNYINLIETGKRLPSMQGFFSICEYLKVVPSDFLRLGSPELSPKDLLIQEIVRDLNFLGENEISTVRKMVHALI